LISMADLAFLSSGTVLVDTCFLLDANSKPKVYGDFIGELRGNGVTVVSLELVRVEFVRTKKTEDFKKKLAYFNGLVESILPVDVELERLILDLIVEYGEDLDGVSVIDLYLAAALKRYKNLFLLTSNHRDFPGHVFTRCSVFNFELPKAVQTYAFYRYKDIGKVVEIANELPF
jgi:hypothetical protein